MATLSFFILSSQEVHAQVDSSTTMKKKLNFGLGLGVNFVGGTNISLASNLTYQLTEKISLGGGLQFNYIGLKDVQNTTSNEGNALAFYTPLKQFLTTLEFSQMYINRNLLSTNTKDNFWESALFIGAGYQITSKISFKA